jgi:hypothetical protein
MWKPLMRGLGKRDDRAPEDVALRRLLDAAAARPEELPGLSPFLAARVRAIAATRRSVTAAPQLAAVAWHALPALAALVVVLTAWAALETAGVAGAQDDAAMMVLASRDAGADAPLATILLAGPETPGGGE